MINPQSSSSKPARLSGKRHSSRLLLGAVATSAVASVCCLGPLLLLTLGVSGVWMSSLMLVQDWYPLLAGISVTLLILAGRQLLQARACVTTGCAESLSSFSGRQIFGFIVALLLTLIFLSSEYWLLWSSA